jgi:hypothetical protein
MPTSVRNLVYDLPRPERGVEARVVDRDFDQAVSEFVPGSVRTKDKRLLKPVGLVGSRVAVDHQTERWGARNDALGACFYHLYCAACRRLLEAQADSTAVAQGIEDPAAPSWWRSEWVRKRGELDCPSCSATNSSRAYLAVAPGGFITDLDPNKSADARESRARTAGLAQVMSPPLSSLAYSAVGNAEIGLSSNGRVYRSNRNGPRADLFALAPVPANVNPNAAYWRPFDGQRWAATDFLNGQQPQIRTAIVSPKVTDLLAIRSRSGSGLSFIDGPGRLASRRAAWASAATILQRAVGLELDVDSMDIEVASVHHTSSYRSAGREAELYLSDDHPNGAGVVAWLKDNWEPLLRGLLLPGQPLHRFADAVRLQLTAQSREPWRSPDLLLKGFRNRSFHGLLDFSLGIELLACLLDASFRPGIDTSVMGQASHTLPTWVNNAHALAKAYVAAFPNVARPLPPQTGIAGWLENDGVWSVVVHPLWDDEPGPLNGLGHLMASAAQAGAAAVRLVDSFNLGRRMAWCRSKRSEWPTIPLAVGALAPNPPAGNPLAGAPESLLAKARRYSPGMEFRDKTDQFVRENERSLAGIGDGQWVVETPDGDEQVVLVRNMQPAVLRRVRFRGTTIDDALAARYVVVARLVDSKER